MAAIKISQLSFRYRKQTPFVFKNFNLVVQDKELLLLTGSNGSGKSTLLKIIAGALKATSGRVTIDKTEVIGGEPLVLSDSVAFQQQNPDIQFANIFVAEEIAFKLENHLLEPSLAKKSLLQAEASFDLEILLDRDVFSLSGGEKQRVNIAASVLPIPKVLLLDEPLLNLDAFQIENAINYLKKLKGQITIIIASHNVKPLLSLVDRKVDIEQGPYRRKPSAGSRKYRKARTQIIKDTRLSQGTMISARNLNYRIADKVVLNNINLTIQAGERVVLTGANGTGKTTLARLLCGLIKPTSGVLIKDYKRPYIVIQNPTLGFIGNTVLDEIQYGTHKSQTEIRHLLQYFNLWQYRDRSPFKLSEGEKRKLAIAVACSVPVDFLVIDEPTAGMDDEAVDLTLDIVDKSFLTVLQISHDARILRNSSQIVQLGSSTEGVWK